MGYVGAPKLSAFDLKAWVDEHRHLLKPPVGNVQMWKDCDIIFMVIGGPNQRTDYHDDPYEEIFYQIQGDMTLRIIQGGKPVDVPIREGEVYFLPAHVRHSPQRPAGSVGLVIERTRPPGVLEAFEWFCDSCDHRVHRREVDLVNIETDMPPVFDEYYGSEELRTCPHCGNVNPGRPKPVEDAAE